MKNKMTDSDIVNFGKYKGETFEWLIKNDRDYCCNFILKSPGFTNRDITTYILENLENETQMYLEDKYLKNAWYLQQNGKILEDLELDPEFCHWNEKYYKQIFENYGNLSSIDYYKRIGLNIVDEYWKCSKTYKDENPAHIPLKTFIKQGFEPQFFNNLEMSFEIYTTDKSFVEESGNIYPKIELMKIIYQLFPFYNKNLRHDERWKGYPSKIILRYWVFFKEFSSCQGEGKWCLFFDKMEEDENRMSELDRNYTILKDNYHKITKNYAFKCSTRRPNENAGSYNQNGVIIIYTNESDKELIIQKIHKLLKLKNKVYWKFHRQGYAKDGIKASTYSFDPENN